MAFIPALADPDIFWEEAHDVANPDFRLRGRQFNRACVSLYATLMFSLKGGNVYGQTRWEAIAGFASLDQPLPRCEAFLKARAERW